MTTNTKRIKVIVSIGAVILSTAVHAGAPASTWEPRKDDLKLLDRPTLYGAFSIRLPRNVRENALPIVDHTDVRSVRYSFTDTKKKPTLNLIVAYVEGNPQHQSPRELEDDLLSAIQSAYVRSQSRQPQNPPKREYGSIDGVAAAREYFQFVDPSNQAATKTGFVYAASTGKYTIVVGATDYTANAVELSLTETAALTIKLRPAGHSLADS